MLHVVLRTGTRTAMEIELSVVRHGWGPPAREWAGIDAFLTDIDCFQPEPEPELEPPADMLETTGSGVSCEHQSFASKSGSLENFCGNVRLSNDQKAYPGCRFRA